MHINIYTNTQKSQFRQVKDGIWQILGIPITVDDAVMNGNLYDKNPYPFCLGLSLFQTLTI